MSRDEELSMFIECVCANCMDHKCDGALVEAARVNCSKYAYWKHLPDQHKVKLFAEQLTNQLYMLEDLIDGEG